MSFVQFPDIEWPGALADQETMRMPQGPKSRSPVPRRGEFYGITPVGIIDHAI